MTQTIGYMSPVLDAAGKGARLDTWKVAPPLLAEKGITAMVVTSGIIAIPKEWMGIPGVRVAVSVDGLPEHHDVRRNPATYERILRNIEGRKVDLSWVIAQVMMERRGYLEEYLEFWSARPKSTASA